LLIYRDRRRCVYQLSSLKKFLISGLIEWVGGGLPFMSVLHCAQTPTRIIKVEIHSLNHRLKLRLYGLFHASAMHCKQAEQNSDDVENH
jgi:hypothetical protein